jgi:HD-GYP domain-containing protein (c-di-GMP phosphodiesterase class II)
VQAQIQVKKVMVRLGTVGHININKINIIIEDIIQQLLSKKDIVLTISKLRSIDDYTYEHSVNVCVLSLLVGVDLFLDKESLKNLGIGAILHDIGKSEFLRKYLKNHLNYHMTNLKK